MSRDVSTVQGESIPQKTPVNPYGAKLIAQSLDALAVQTHGNPDYLLTLQEFPRIALEAPSSSGGKFWIGAATESGITIRWGKYGTAGTTKHIPLTQCKQNNSVLELKTRSLGKIAKGYDILPHDTQLP